MREERFLFRIFGASSELIDALLSAYGPSIIVVRKCIQDKSVNILSIVLSEDLDYQPLIDIVHARNIDRHACGVWASLVTDRDSDGISVPEYVVNLYSKIGHTIDFSFTTG